MRKWGLRAWGTLDDFCYCWVQERREGKVGIERCIGGRGSNESKEELTWMEYCGSCGSNLWNSRVENGWGWDFEEWSLRGVGCARKNCYLICMVRGMRKNFSLPYPFQVWLSTELVLAEKCVRLNVLSLQGHWKKIQANEKFNAFRVAAAFLNIRWHRTFKEIRATPYALSPIVCLAMLWGAERGFQCFVMYW